MAAPSLVEQLGAMLSAAGVSEADQRRGVSLSETGTRTVARKLRIAEAEVAPLLRSLAAYLTEDAALLASLHEDLGAPRYSFEPDALGNVTVRDASTGKSTFLRGSAASALLNRLKRTSRETQQQILAAYQPTMSEAADANDEDHNDALKRTGFWGAAGAGCIPIAADTGRLLLMHRSREVEQPHTWGTCGGAIDRGDDPKGAAIRELAEEAGYHGPIIEMIPLFVFKKESFRYFNFLAVVESEFDPRLNWESQDAEWVEFGDWPEPLHFGVSAVLNDPKSVKTIQAVIARATTQTNESVLGEALEQGVTLDEEQDFNEEIRQSGGFYNFPWSVGSQHGTGSARFNGRGPQMQIVVKSVRDSAGKPIDPDKKLAEAIHQQAIDFIGDE